MAQQTPGFCTKDPDASAWPKGIDYTDYLAAIGPGETIVSSSWAITGPDSALTFSAATIVTGNLQTQLRLSGGTLGGRYTVTNSFVTSSGVHDDDSFVVLIEQK